MTKGTEPQALKSSLLPKKKKGQVHAHSTREEEGNLLQRQRCFSPREARMSNVGITQFHALSPRLSWRPRAETTQARS